MKSQKRADIIGRMNEITRELERLVLAPVAKPDPGAVQELRDEQEALENALKSDGLDASS